MKVFLFEENAFIAKIIATEFRTRGHTILATNLGAETGVKQGEFTFPGTIKDADVICYPLFMHTSVDQITALISYLRQANKENYAKYLSEKTEDNESEQKQFRSQTLIGISSLQTWNETQSTVKFCKESQFKSRKASNHFTYLRSLETLIITAEMNEKPIAAKVTNSKVVRLLQSYVVAAGIFYGNGENELHRLFRAAWMNENEPLTYYSDSLDWQKKSAEELQDDWKQFLETNISERTRKPQGAASQPFLPMIHSSDFAAMLHYLITLKDRPSQSYYIAVDKGKQNQFDIISTIRNRISDGKSEIVREFVGMPEENTSESSSANPSIVKENFLLNGRYVSEFLNEHHQNFNWKSKKGFIANFDLVFNDFVATRSLRPIKIGLYGPPSSGKTIWAKKIASEYRIPYLHISEVINSALESHEEIGDEVRMYVNECKRKWIEEQTALISPKNKSKGKDKKITKNAPVVPSVLEMPPVRYPTTILTRIVKHQLQSSECRNKGYVLDGYPRTAEEVNSLWPQFKLPMEDSDDSGASENDSNEAEENLEDNKNLDADAEENENDEEEEEECSESNEEEATEETEVVEETAATPFTKNQIQASNDTIELIVNFQISEQSAYARCQNLDATTVKAGHNDEEGMKRRWAKWKSYENASAQLASNKKSPVDTESFSSSNPAASMLPALGILNIIERFDVSEEMAQNETNVWKSICCYIEKDGKPYNYHPTEAESDEEWRQLEEKQKEFEEKCSLEREKYRQYLEQQTVEIELERSRRTNEIAEESARMIEAASLPLRSYLYEAVLPALMDGLVDICQTKPEDPIDYLADWLLRYSMNANAKSSTTTS